MRGQVTLAVRIEGYMLYAGIPRAGFCSYSILTQLKFARAKVFIEGLY